MADALIRTVDCVSMPVADLSAAVVFYRDKLAHDLLWRSDTQAGFRLPDTETELVVQNPSAADCGASLSSMSGTASAQPAAPSAAPCAGEWVKGGALVGQGLCPCSRYQRSAPGCRGTSSGVDSVSRPSWSIPV